MSYIGIPPYGQTVRSLSSYTATAGQTTFYPTGGYTVTYLDVYLNGIRQVYTSDYTASDGLSVVFTDPLVLNDVVEIVVYQTISFADSVKRSGDTLQGTYYTQDVLPATNNYYSLGSTDMRYNDIYLSNGSIHIGDVVISSNATNLIVANTTGGALALSNTSLPNTGVTAGSYGNSSAIPVITVDSTGRITSATTNAVAGVTGYTYTAANATFTITTGTGTTYLATIAANSITTSMLTDSGVTAGAYGNTTAIPVITVDAKGRVTSMSTSSVAGVSGVSWTAANNTVTVATSVGNYSANMNSWQAPVTFSNTVAAGNTSITGSATVSTTLGVTGAVTVGNTVGATGAATFANTLAVTGNATFSNTLAVTGTSTFTGLITGTITSANNADYLDGQHGSYYAPIANPTFTANATITNALTANTLAVSNYIDFANNASTPSQKEGRMFYDQNTKTMAYYTGEADVTLNIGQENWVYVYNTTGSTIPNGSAVRFNGALNGTPLIALADSSTLAGVTWIAGITTHSIENNTYGYVTSYGKVNGVDLSSYSIGDPLYVSSTPGSLTKTLPSPPYYAALVGGVLANTASGSLMVKLEPYEYSTLRVSGEARVDGKLTVVGDLNILGNTTSTSVSSLNVGNTVIYLSGGNHTSNTNFVGTGINDASFDGHLQYSNTTTFYVKIDSVGATDTFAWSTDNFATTVASGVAITGSSQWLGGGMSVTFEATTGHTLNDKWSATLTPVNIDSGIIGNYHTGENGIYAHAGYFRDASDSKFRFFTGYTPEPNTSINISDASFAYADVQANTFYGKLIGNVTGNADTATTANNASYLGGQLASYYANSTAPGTAYTNAISTAANANNLTSGTVNPARLPQANTSANGAVLLLDSVSNTATSVYAPTMSAVKTAYDAAITANTNAATASSKADAAYTNAVAYAASNTYVNTQLGLKASLSGATFSGAVSGIITLAAGNTTITGFANVTSNIQGGGSLTIAGAASGITTLAAGNTTITGTMNVSSTAQFNVAGSSAGASVLFNSGTGVLAAMFGSGSTSGFTADQVGGAVRFNGSGVAWGDLSFYPTAGAGNQGNFRLSTTGSILSTTPSGKLGVGELYSVGNVGIGNTNPSHKLSVNGTSYFGANSTIVGKLDISGTSSPTLRLIENAQTGNPKIQLLDSSNADTPTEGMEMWYESSTGHGYLSTIYSLGSLILRTANTARITIANTGNVGISNSTPSHTLSVGGTANFSSSVNVATTFAAGNTTITGFANVTSTLQVSGTSALNGRVTIKDTVNADTSYPLGIQNGAQQQWWFRAGTSSNDFALHLNGTGDRFNILAANGNVGISNTAPAHKLSVNGNIYAGVPFIENATAITANYTVAANTNAMSAGPITIADGVTVTVSDGSTWTVV